MGFKDQGWLLAVCGLRQDADSTFVPPDRISICPSRVVAKIKGVVPIG